MGLGRSDSISSKHGLRSWPKAIIRWSSLAMQTDRESSETSSLNISKPILNQWSPYDYDDMMGLTIGSTWWMASGFCPRAASTVSVFSRNLWQQAPHMQTPRISAMCISATWIHLGDWEWWKCNWNYEIIARSEGRPWAGIFQSKAILRDRSLHYLFLGSAVQAFLLWSDISAWELWGLKKHGPRTMDLHQLPKNYGHASTSQPL